MTARLEKPPKKLESKENFANTQKELDALKKSITEKKSPEEMAEKKFDAIYNSIRGLSNKDLKKDYATGKIQAYPLKDGGRRLSIEWDYEGGYQKTRYMLTQKGGNYYLTISDKKKGQADNTDEMSVTPYEVYDYILPNFSNRLEEAERRNKEIEERKTQQKKDKIVKAGSYADNHNKDTVDNHLYNYLA